jgi:hypothetical protein
MLGICVVALLTVSTTLAPPDQWALDGAIAFTPTVTCVVVEPQLFLAVTVYRLAGQLSAVALPVISHECVLKLRPSGNLWPSGTSKSQFVTPANSPARLMMLADSVVVARVRVNDGAEYLITGHTAITLIVMVNVVLPPLLVAVTVYDFGVTDRALGVPLISPVLVLIESPAGRGWLMANVSVAPPAIDALLMEDFLLTLCPSVSVMVVLPPL